MPQKSTITIENNDSQMWHLDRIIIDIMSAANLGNDIVLHLNSEGPCARSLGLYDLLDNVCNSTGYRPDQFEIVTCNLKEQHDQYPITIAAPIKHINGLQQQLKNSPIEYKKITNYTKHFGNFAVHGSRIRLVIASYLYANYQDKTLQTYHCVPSDTYHRKFIGLEDILFYKYNYKHFNNACNLLQHTPLTFDIVQSYPVLDQKMYGINQAYQDIFVDIVCQTYHTGNTFYVDEKLWRPIITRTPFMVHGPQNFVNNFKQLGFQTFDQWWDEGYSEDPTDYQVEEIITNIDQLSQRSTQELQKMYEDMKPVLDHNYNLFLNLTSRSFFKEYH